MPKPDLDRALAHFITSTKDTIVEITNALELQGKNIEAVEEIVAGLYKWAEETTEALKVMAAHLETMQGEIYRLALDVERLHE